MQSAATQEGNEARKNLAKERMRWVLLGRTGLLGRIWAARSVKRSIRGSGAAMNLFQMGWA